MKSYRPLAALLFAAVILLGASTIASAQTQAGMESRIEALEQKLNQLEKRVDAALPAQSQALVRANYATNGASADRMAELEDKVQLLEAAQKNNLTATTSEENGKATKVSLDSKGFVVTSGDFRFRIGGYVQADAKTFIDDTTHGLSGTVANTIYPQNDAFTIRRARLIINGSYGKHLDFYVAPEFSGSAGSSAMNSIPAPFSGLSPTPSEASTSSPGVSLYDAYADFKITPFAVIRGGKFKTPFGLEQLQSATDLTFMDRSLATDLVPNRDEGFYLWGNVLNRFIYQVGVVNGALDNNGSKTDGSAHDGRTIVARVFATPFAKQGPKVLQGLGFGAALTSGQQNPVTSGGALISGGLTQFKTVDSGAVFFKYLGTAETDVTNGSYPCVIAKNSSSITCPTNTSAKNVIVTSALGYNTVVANGNEFRFSPQAYYYYGPFGVLAEYVQDGQHMAGSIGSSSVTTTNPAGAKIFVENSAGTHYLKNHAYNVTGSWVITGEKKTYNGVVPKRSLENWRNPIMMGAWEIGARYSELNIDKAAFAQTFDSTRKAVSYFAADPTKYPQAAREWGIALNWYLSQNLRMDFDYEQTKFKGFGNAFVLPTDKAFEQRLQVVF